MPHVERRPDEIEENVPEGEPETGWPNRLPSIQPHPTYLSDRYIFPGEIEENVPEGEPET